MLLSHGLHGWTTVNTDCAAFWVLTSLLQRTGHLDLLHQRQCHAAHSTFQIVPGLSLNCQEQAGLLQDVHQRELIEVEADQPLAALVQTGFRV